MGIGSSQAILSRAGKNLLISWSEVVTTWRDDNRRQFEQEYISPLKAELRKTELAMAHMSTMITRARNDCR